MVEGPSQSTNLKSIEVLNLGTFCKSWKFMFEDGLHPKKPGTAAEVGCRTYWLREAMLLRFLFSEKYASFDKIQTVKIKYRLGSLAIVMCLIVSCLIFKVNPFGPSIPELPLKAYIKYSDTVSVSVVLAWDWTNSRQVLLEQWCIKCYAAQENFLRGSQGNNH